MIKSVLKISLVFLSLQCHQVYRADNKVIKMNHSSIKGFRIYREFPVIDSNGAINHYLPYETRIYINGSQRLLQTTYYHADMYSLADLEKPVYRPVYYSFVYTINQGKGILGDSNNVSSFRPVLVDSVLKKEWIYIPDNFGYLINDVFSTLLYNKEEDHNSKEIKFSFVGKKDTSMKGEYTLFFSNNESLKQFEYSFSSFFDSVYKMKLVGIVTEYLPRYFPKEKYLLGKVRIPYKMEEISIENDSEIRSLFKLQENFFGIKY